VAKIVVFVQGGKANEASHPWKFFHLHPTKEPTPESVDLVYFDYPAGQRKTWKNLLLRRGEPPKQAPDTTEDLPTKVKIRLVDGTTDDDGPDRASVLDLYDWVKLQAKGSIQSLQVFSHGWQGGPIIWNSSEFDPEGIQLDPLDNQARDPNDTDFRIRDFYGTNPLAGAEGRKFADAFTSDALIKLWGCVAPPGPRAALRRYTKAPSGTKGDQARASALQQYLTSVAASFPLQMATQLNLSVWASPVGWGSEPGTKVPTNRSSDPPCSSANPASHCMSVKYKGTFPPDLSKDQWWRVSWFFRNQDGGARFYTDVLKANIDAVDFVEHKGTWFEDATKVAFPDLESNAVDTPADLQSRVQNQADALNLA
jgi:hypothetical protein